MSKNRFAEHTCGRCRWFCPYRHPGSQRADYKHTGDCTCEIPAMPNLPYSARNYLGAFPVIIKRKVFVTDGGGKLPCVCFMEKTNVV